MSRTRVTPFQMATWFATGVAAFGAAIYAPLPNAAAGEEHCFSGVRFACIDFSPPLAQRRCARRRRLLTDRALVAIPPPQLRTWYFGYRDAFLGLPPATPLVAERPPGPGRPATS